MNFKHHFFDLELSHHKKKRLTLFIIASLLFHVFLLFFVLHVGFNISLPELVKAFEQKIQQIQPVFEKNEMPAALKPKKSDFGSFVFFDNPTDTIPQQMPEPVSNGKAEVQVEAPTIKEKAPEKKQAMTELKKEIIAKPQEPEKKLVQKELAKPTAPKKIEESVIKAPGLPKEVKQTAKNEVAEKTESKKEFKKAQQKLADRIKNIEETQQKVAALEKQKEEFSPLVKREAAKALPAPKQNIVAMTRGFLENLKDKGDDWLERKGDENKMPSFEELKYLSYEQRINWQLQASWKQHFARHFSNRPLQGKVAVEFSINESGALTHANIIQSSGMRELDDIILASVRKAAPFPPLPKHFNKTIYPTARIISVHAHMFGF
ncbi:TonB family protein [Candidatus Babeliales bacterium]|nr:TonB family protein [Candidatus Babeliales bacterium]